MTQPPPCFNRPPRAPGFFRTGIINGQIERVWVSSQWAEDACKTHEGTGIGKNGETFPEAHGWMPWCRQCRWAPASIQEAAA